MGHWPQIDQERLGDSAQIFHIKIGAKWQQQGTWASGKFTGKEIEVMWRSVRGSQNPHHVWKKDCLERNLGMKRRSFQVVTGAIISAVWKNFQIKFQCCDLRFLLIWSTLYVGLTDNSCAQNVKENSGFQGRWCKVLQSLSGHSAGVTSQKEGATMMTGTQLRETLSLMPHRPRP